MAAFGSRRLISALCGVCSERILTKPSVPVRISGWIKVNSYSTRSKGTVSAAIVAKYIIFTSPAGVELLKVVNNQLKFKRFEELPEVTGFSYSIEGAKATFTRKVGNEDITVTLDANSAVQLDMMGEDDPDESEVVNIECR